MGAIRIFHFLNFLIWYEIELCAADFPLQLMLFHDDLNFLTFHVETRRFFTKLMSSYIASISEKRGSVIYQPHGVAAPS